MNDFLDHFGALREGPHVVSPSIEDHLQSILQVSSCFLNRFSLRVHARKLLNCSRPPIARFHLDRGVVHQDNSTMVDREA